MPLSMSDAEILHRIESEFNRKYDYFRVDRDRFIEHAKLYWAVDYGQWPIEVVQRLMDENRQAPTFPMLTQKMDGLRASLLRNQFDIKYEPMEGSIDEMSLAAQNMWYSDKNSMHWDYSYNVFLRDFLVQWGCERMVIDKTLHPLGNISFKPESPILLFPDPNWRTDDDNDLNLLDKVGYFTGDELKHMFPEKERELEFVRLQNLYKHAYYGERESGPPHQFVDAKWGNKQRVIERHEMIEEEREWEHDITSGIVPFPETGFKNGSKEDIEAKRHYMLVNEINPENIKFIKTKHKRYHVTTICHDYNIILEDKDSPIQIGRLPFFLTGPARYGSQFRGIPDLAKDTQLNLNKYMMMMEEILNKSARGGFFIDPAIVGGEEDRMEEVEMEWNNPAARIWTKDGALSVAREKYIQEFPSAHIPNDLVGFKRQMDEFFDKLTHQTPTAEGRQESAKESGKLFQSKFEATVIARGTIDRQLEQHQQNKAEAFVKQAKLTYSGVPREFNDRHGGKFTLNEPRGDGIHLDISSLPRQKVIIMPSQKGVDVRINQRGLFAELKQTTQNPLMHAIYDQQILNTLEMTDDQREEAMEALSLLRERAATQEKLLIAQGKMQLAQMGQSAMQGQPQLPEGGGVDVGVSVSAGGEQEQIEAPSTPPTQGGDLAQIEDRITGRT